MRKPWVCVEANLVVRLVANPSDESIGRLWEQWEADGRQLAAPALLYYEVTNALHRYQQLGLMSASSVKLALRAALALRVRVHSEADWHWRALEVVKQLSLPDLYDAHYLAVAQWLGGEFWTTDRRLVRVAQPTFPWVHLAM